MSHFPIEKRKLKRADHHWTLHDETSVKRTLKLLNCQDAVMFSIIAASCSQQSLSLYLSRNEMINSISLAANYLERSRSLPPHLAQSPDSDKRRLISVCRINHVNISLPHLGSAVNGLLGFHPPQ